jgi:hypothetical protein
VNRCDQGHAYTFPTRKTQERETPRASVILEKHSQLGALHTAQTDVGPAPLHLEANPMFIGINRASEPDCSIGSHDALRRTHCLKLFRHALVDKWEDNLPVCKWFERQSRRLLD